MTKLKISGTMPAAARAALEPHIAAMYARPGVRRMIVGELHHALRTQPAPDGESEPEVTCRLSAVEVASLDQEEAVRELLRAMYLERTASGTLTEEFELQLSKQTIAQAAGIYQLQQVARLSAGIHGALDYIARVQANDRLTLTELRHELDQLRAHLRAALGQPTLDDGPAEGGTES